MVLHCFPLNKLYFIYYLGNKPNHLLNLLYSTNCYKKKYKSTKISKIYGGKLIKELVDEGYVQSEIRNEKIIYGLTDQGTLLYNLIIERGIYTYFQDREIKEKRRSTIKSLILIGTFFFLILIIII